MSVRSETFGRLLKGAINSIATYERRTAPVVEEELAAKVGLAGSAIQRYKAGHLPPDPRTVEVLAEAAIQRAYLNRVWLQQFLAAARYPNAAALLDQLCPAAPERPRPPRVARNLPAPTYSQFVMREEAFAEVMDGLGKRSAAVIIVGMGGTGKTSLAHEAAVQCLAPATHYPSFDAGIWISDKDRPGATNLSVVLDEIARTLDYPGFTQYAHDEKRRAVEQLLRGQRVLVCVDNFETVTDAALLEWLLNLPEPSKALITTREDRREFRHGGWPVELRGMTEAEARAFVDERLYVLRLGRLVSDSGQLRPLIAATAGNPKAIELVLGLVKYQRQPLQELIDQLYAARGEIFDDLFSRAWSLLDLPAQQVLLVLTFFPASASDAALRASADVQNFTFDRTREQLTGLSLVDVQQVDLARPPRYTLHPLVRAFAGARLAERPAFTEEARRRWVGWYVELAGQVGHCWNEPERLDWLEPEQESVFAAIQWAAEHGLHSQTTALAHGVGYFYHVRGHWDKRVTVNRLRAMAARSLGDRPLEAQSLANCVLTLTAQDNLDDAEPLAAQLAEMAEAAGLVGDVLCRVQRAIAHVQLAHGDLRAAQQELEAAIAIDGVSDHDRAIAREELADCLYRQGLLDDARQILEDALNHAREMAHPRGIIVASFRLAAIDLDRGDNARADERLRESLTLARKYHDQQYLPEVLRLVARQAIQRSDPVAARAAIVEANDWFERLGKRRELAETRVVLESIETGDARTAALYVRHPVELPA